MVVDANLIQGFELGFGLGCFVGMILSGIVALVILWQMRNR